MEEKLDMEHRMTEVEGRCRSNTHRLDKLEEAIKMQMSAESIKVQIIPHMN